MKQKGKLLLDLCREHFWFWCAAAFLEVFSFFCLWLTDSRKTQVILGMVLIIDLGIFAGMLWYLLAREIKREQEVQALLDEPDFWKKEPDIKTLSLRERRDIRLFLGEIENLKNQIEDLKVSREEQSSYVETWVHEIKTPLSLMTLLLENREEEISRQVYQRLWHVNTRIQEYVDQILYFSRLNCAHKDAFFENVSLSEVIEYVLSDYCFFLKEQDISIQLLLEEGYVFTDKKGIEFMLCQVVSNAVKYLAEIQEQKYIQFTSRREEELIFLEIRDNGIGLPASDLPFVFDKGFSGDNRKQAQKSTGMGLYLVGEMARSLHICIEAEGEQGAGFCIRMGFPIIRTEHKP